MVKTISLIVSNHAWKMVMKRLSCFPFDSAERDFYFYFLENEKEESGIGRSENRKEESGIVRNDNRKEESGIARS